MACTECASTIQQMEGFVLKAQEVERTLLERSKRTSVSNAKSPLEIRSLVDSLGVKKTKPRPATVNEVLRKLNTSSIVIKKIDKKDPIKIDQPTKTKRIDDDEPLLKMKVEVLDEEVEHLPADDFVHYDDTDDDEEEGQVIARRSFRHIEAVNIKEMHSTDESSQEAYPEERLEIELDPDYIPNEQIVRLFINQC